MCLFLKCDRDSAKQALCLKNSLMCLATTHKSSEGGGKLSSLVCICVFVYSFIIFLSIFLSISKHSDFILHGGLFTWVIVVKIILRITGVAKKQQI